MTTITLPKILYRTADHLLGSQMTEGLFLLIDHMSYV